jgi:hypothetical protein
MKLTPDIRIKRAIIGPEDEIGKDCIIPGMGPEHLERAVVRVDEEGWAYVTWLEVQPGWRNALYEMVGKPYIFVLNVGLASLLFWVIGILLIRQGMI